MRPIFFALPILITLAGCKGGDSSAPDAAASQQPPAVPASAAPDPLAAHDNAPAPQELPDSEARPTMQAQVVLDRLGFTPGVVDGKVEIGRAHV